MKKEFGKWLMDIAKYITTAVILTSVLGEIGDNKNIVLFSISAVFVCLVCGLFLVQEPKDSRGKNNKKRR